MVSQSVALYWTGRDVIAQAVAMCAQSHTICAYHVINRGHVDAVVCDADNSCEYHAADPMDMRL